MTIAHIRAKHQVLAEEMGLINWLASEFEELERMLMGIKLVGEASPRLRARIMACGELLSTRLGVAYLQLLGLDVGWLDIREHLEAEDDRFASNGRSWLNAKCRFESDPRLQRELKAMPHKAIITQGFIARNKEGHTVLLGRGGSDTSASYLAARLSAQRCEIWTDVPGMFTANPRQIPSARLLKYLDYDEAQEIATTGAKVLHPACIAPMRQHAIPLHIHCTMREDLESTMISNQHTDRGALVKSISMKMSNTLVSMNTIGMWGQIGFLADVFACFKELGLSVDLVSTSEANVTASLDKQTNNLNSELLDNLKHRLSRFCTVRIIEPCATISLVGRNIRAILHKLGPALEIFEEQKIYC
jgi:diaminopimelate decarboxylase/aspartate kinase